jgi:hypothetical protein
MFIVTVGFKSIYRFDIHENNIFFIFLKFIFDITILKQYKNIKNNFFKSTTLLEKQTHPYVN